MKFEESSLSAYLVKNLEPLTEADPVILAKYVSTLLKKDKPAKELQKLCTENLVDFLGQGTKTFVVKLFQALEDGSILASAECSDAIKQVEPSSGHVTVDPIELNGSSPKPERLSTSSGHVSDTEEKEVTDDDDDDRNHKHRRREARSQSFDKDAQEQFLRRPNRKRNKPFDNGQLFLESDPQSSETRKEYNPSPLERDFSSKFEKRRPVLARAPLGTGQRTRVHQTFRNDPARRFDLSASIGYLPIGRGRGMPPWNQHDSRFGSVDTLDFASQMPPQGPTPPGLFGGMGLPNTASTQAPSWGTFGLIHGVPNGGLDTLHPLGLQGALRPPINPSLSIGMPRQRCRDFEERGFCLRGDMCPMEHGVNRIVVEDVQSLSQFNLPVSIPSGRLLGMQTVTGPLPTTTASSLLTNGKVLQSKNGKPGVPDDELCLNGVLSGSASAHEADLYDPDQPLWNNNCPETSSSLLRLPSPKIDDNEPLWDAYPSDRSNFRLSDGIDSARPARSMTTKVGSQSISSSVWGRIGNSQNKLEISSEIDNIIRHETKEDQQTLTNVRGSAHQGKQATAEEVGPQSTNFVTTIRRNVGKSSQKALRTLFVNNIPLTNNKREALHSHFKKFGEVIDIYIPLNSERAFVQFSKRVEAEAALKAPDAVMGNRFIKLWWANRDNIHDEGESSRHAVSSVQSQPSVLDRGKENIPYEPPKVSSAPATDAPMPAATVPPRTVAINSPKPVPPLQKKLESLELLKELRLKQEMLEQRRNDFRRQLDKLEKQAITVKGEVHLEQAAKRLKTDTISELAKAATPRSINPSNTGVWPEAVKILNKSNSGDNLLSPSAVISSTMPQPSPRNLKQPSRLLAPTGLPFPVNRFKLDNRPTAFRILPPLPVDFANIAVLKEHFSSFSDLAGVEVEVPEADTSSTGSKSSENCSARITFTTRRSAERAFSNGKCWKGHNLQFTWLAVSSNSSNDQSGVENSSNPTPRRHSDTEILSEVVIPVTSSSTRKSTDTVISQEATIAGNKEPENVEGTSGGNDCLQKELLEASGSTISSCEKQSPKGDVSIVEDGTLILRSEVSIIKHLESDALDQ